MAVPSGRGCSTASLTVQLLDLHFCGEPLQRTCNALYMKEFKSRPFLIMLNLKLDLEPGAHEAIDCKSTPPLSQACYNFPVHR